MTVQEEIAPTLRAQTHGHEPIVIDRAAFNQGINAKYEPHIEESQVMDTLIARGPHAVMCMASGQANTEIEQDMAPAQAVRQYKDQQTVCMTDDNANEYVASNGEDCIGALCDRRIRMNRYEVRKLTPRECELLQGFPDDWTLIEWNGKPAEQCPDTPRYKALGNSMAVPVMRWIGERIEMVDKNLSENQL